MDDFCQDHFGYGNPQKVISLSGGQGLELAIEAYAASLTKKAATLPVFPSLRGHCRHSLF